MQLVSLCNKVWFQTNNTYPDFQDILSQDVIFNGLGGLAQSCMQIANTDTVTFDGYNCMFYFFVSKRGEEWHFYLLLLSLIMLADSITYTNTSTMTGLTISNSKNVNVKNLGVSGATEFGIS